MLRASRRVPGVVLVIVKEAGNLLLQLRRVTLLAKGSGVVEKLPLDASRQLVPLQDHGCAEAPQYALLILSEKCLRRWVRRQRTSFAFPAGKSVDLIAHFPDLNFSVGHVLPGPTR
jgi:hypothetical protein